jgi:poly-gamma-glutamate synthesis protein (capsule biosynthesis protein)
MPHKDGSGDITFALTGDAIISRRLSVYQEPEFLEVRRLMQGATAAFTNAEILFLDYDEPDVIPSAQSGGTYMRAAPELVDELTWLGVDLVSLANNHTMDYGVGGLRANKRWIEAAGLVHAGVGENLAQARAPGYLETPGGRVALISVASTFADFGRAGPQRKDMRGRPGLSPIRYQTIHYVTEARFEQLAGLLNELTSELGVRGSVRGDELRFLGETFRKGDQARTTTVPHEGDLEEILATIRDAKRQANWVIVTSHSHESGASRDVPADFIMEFARAAIDAGADLWVGHGPHILRGIEIYKGKPIFYSLGNFIFQNETVELQPADNYLRYGLSGEHLPADFYDTREERSGGGFPANPLYWEAVIAVAEFRAGQLSEIRLHPITLGHGLPRPQRGRPLIAKGDLGRKIIGDLQRLSAPLGTKISFENGIGVIRVPAAVSQNQP